MTDVRFENSKRSLYQRRIFELDARVEKLRKKVQKGNYDEDNLKELASILSAIRSDLTGNDARLSEAIGLPSKTISQTYSGKSRPKYSNFMKMLHGAGEMLARERRRPTTIPVPLDIASEADVIGDSVSKPVRIRSKRSNVFLTEDDLIRVQELALKSHTSISAVMGAALNEYSEARISNNPRSTRRKTASETLLIENRSEIIRYSNAIIVALQEVVDFKIDRHHNMPPPTLRIDDPSYLDDVQSLILELRHLNSLLEKSSKTYAKVATRKAGSFGKHLNKFLGSYATSLGKGAAALTIGTAVGLLYQAGVSREIIDAIWAHTKH